MHGLVVGRFQPLHKGHEALVKAAIEDCVHVTVAVGSFHAKPGTRNPFTGQERVEMVRRAFGDQVRVVPLPDIHDPPNWVAHVTETVGPFDKVFGNDERTTGLFEDADIPVRSPGLVERERLEASIVRMQMAEDDPAWRKAVSPAVVAYLDEIEAAKRIRLLGARA